MNANDLNSGDALLLGGSGPIATPIKVFEGGTFDHAAMVVFDLTSGGQSSTPFVYEMTWPRLRRTPLLDWLQSNRPAFAAPLRNPLTPAQCTTLAAWWAQRLGKWYDVPELLAMAGWLPWRRFARWAGLGDLLAPPPLALNGVCSVNCGWAWQAVGLAVASPTAITPADVPTLPFLGPLEPVACGE
jgi:hypothetical protein